jgi:hypothetical protein
MNQISLFAWVSSTNLPDYAVMPLLQALPVSLSGFPLSVLPFDVVGLLNHHFRSSIPCLCPLQFNGLLPFISIHGILSAERTHVLRFSPRWTPPSNSARVLKLKNLIQVQTLRIQFGAFSIQAQS